MVKKKYIVSETMVVKLSERVDTFSAPELRAYFDELLEQGTRNFIIDLDEVSFLDSAGLAALVQLLKHARQAGGDVGVVLPENENVQRIFKLTKFDRVFNIFTTVSAATGAV